MLHRSGCMALVIALICAASCSSAGKSALEMRLEAAISGFPGEVGIAVISGADTISINGDGRFPMFSVVKFHQALAVCDTLRSNAFSRPFTVTVTAEDLKPETWSPMRQRFPNGGTFTLEQLLEYSLVESDNNACDILFARYASPARVESYIHSTGISDCGIVWTEEQQHTDERRCFDNWTTPLAAARLLGVFYDEREVDDYSRMVWDTMSKCRTGMSRIPKYISENTACIVHKTGTGGISADGKVRGINDAGCIILPDGSHFSLAVFITNGACTGADCEELIALIAKICVEELTQSQ